MARNNTQILPNPSTSTELKGSSRISRGFQRVRLASDWCVSTKAGVLISILLVGVLLIVLAAVLLKNMGVRGDSWGEGGDEMNWKVAIWLSWSLFFDPGTQTGIDTCNPWSVLIVALVMSVIGMVYNLTLLGVIIESVRTVLSAWYRRRSRVWCSDHIVLLGWNDKTLHLVAQMSHWMSLQGHVRRIVILVDKDESDMSCAVDEYVSRTQLRGARVKCRRGRPDDANDLSRAGVESAHAIFLLSEELEDGGIVRQIVALGEMPEQAAGSVYADIWDSEKAFALHTMLPGMEIVNTRRLATRLLSLMAFAPDAGSFYIDLIKNLLVVKAADGVVGQRFADVCRTIGDGVCIGLQGKRHGEKLLSPPKNAIVCPGDSLLVLNSKVARLDPKTGDIHLRSWVIPGGQVETMIARPQHPAGSVFIVAGWPDCPGTLIEMLDFYAPPFSKVHILAEESLAEREADLVRLAPLKNITLAHHHGKRICCTDLTALPLEAARAVLVVARRPRGSTATENLHRAIASDSECLLCTAMISGICAGHAGSEIYARRLQAKIVCEILNTSSRRMLQQYGSLEPGCVFFRSNEWEASMLAFAAMQPDGFRACRQLFVGDLAACGPPAVCKRDEFSEYNDSEDELAGAEGKV